MNMTCISCMGNKVLPPFLSTQQLDMHVMICMLPSQSIKIKNLVNRVNTFCQIQWNEHRNLHRFAENLAKRFISFCRSPCSKPWFENEGLHNTQTIYPWPGHRVSPAKAGRRSYLVVGVAFWHGRPFQGLKHEGFTAVIFCKRYQAPSSYLNMFGLFWDTAPFPILTPECFKHISFSEFFFEQHFCTFLWKEPGKFRVIFMSCFTTLFSHLSYRGTKMTTDLIRWFGWSFFLVQMWNITHWSHLWRSQVQRGGSKNPAAPWVWPKAHHLATASRCQGHWAPTAA